MEYCTHRDNVRQAITSGNHVCTRNISGANNPNYGNHILHERYSNDPDLARAMLARPGGQNGRARKVALYDLDEELICKFGCMKDCAMYLIDNHLVKAKSLQRVTSNVAHALKTGEMYDYYYVKTA